jgi:hypothetical protein
MEKKDSPPKNWTDIKREYWTENRTVRSLKHKTDPFRRGFSKHITTPVKNAGERLAEGAKSMWHVAKKYGKKGIGKVKKVSGRIKRSAESGVKKFKDMTDLDLPELKIRETDWPEYRARKWAEFKTGTKDNWKTLKSKARQFPDKVSNIAYSTRLKLGELKNDFDAKIDNWRGERENRRKAREIQKDAEESGGLKTTEERLGQDIDSEGVNSKRNALDELEKIDHGFKKRSKRKVKKTKRKSKTKRKVKKSKRKSKTKRKVKKSKRKTKRKTNRK